MKRIKVMIPGDNLARQDLGGEQSKEIAAPLYYDDGNVVHACESGIIDEGVRLVWTKMRPGRAGRCELHGRGWRDRVVTQFEISAGSAWPLSTISYADRQPG
jgi:hypothetical protein